MTAAILLAGGYGIAAAQDVATVDTRTSATQVVEKQNKVKQAKVVTLQTAKDGQTVEENPDKWPDFPRWTEETVQMVVGEHKISEGGTSQQRAGTGHRALCHRQGRQGDGRQSREKHKPIPQQGSPAADRSHAAVEARREGRAACRSEIYASHYVQTLRLLLLRLYESFRHTITTHVGHNLVFARSYRCLMQPFDNI